MKNFYPTLALIIFTTFSVAQAQSDTSSIGDTNMSKIYLNYGVGVANGQLSGGGLNFIYLNNWGFSFRYSQLKKYEPENNEFKLNELAFLIIREFLNNQNWIRFGIEGGLSFNSHKKYKEPYVPINYSSSGNGANYSGGGLLSGSSIFSFNIIPGGLNYSSSSSSSSPSNNDKLQRAVGLMFRTKVYFPVTNFLGLEIAAVSNLNKFQSYAGVEIHLIIGWLAKK